MSTILLFSLSLQLLLLQKLKFHLTIHSPFRPLTGFLLDIKVRLSHYCIRNDHMTKFHTFQTRAESVPNPEQLTKTADKFLVQSLSTDVSLLYPPSQVRQMLLTIWQIMLLLFVFRLHCQHCPTLPSKPMVNLKGTYAR